MHFFVWLLIVLLIVLIVGLSVGFFWLSTSTSNSKIISEVQFSKVDSTFENGVDGGVLWPASLGPDKAVLSKIDELRGFFAFADWFRTSLSPPFPSPDLPIYFVLPEAVKNAKINVIKVVNIHFPGSTTNLVGELVSPTHVALRFAHGDTPSALYFTGNDLTVVPIPLLPQGIGIAVIYSV